MAREIDIPGLIHPDGETAHRPLELSGFDVSTGEDDGLILAMMKNSRRFTPEQRLGFTHTLGEALFIEEQLDRARVGNFLRGCLTLQADERTPQEFRDQLDGFFTKERLERIEDESNRNRWSDESVADAEAAMETYATFWSAEKMLGPEKAQEFYRELGELITRARAFDEQLDVSVSKFLSLGRGPTIYLGSRGAEVAQVIAQRMLFKVCQEEGVEPVIDPYYRDGILCTNLGKPEDDPNQLLMTREATIGDNVRDSESFRGGTELAVRGNIGKNRKIGVYPGTPNVGGTQHAASGYAYGLRLEKIREEGIEYDKPMRGDAERAIQLENPGSVVLISNGDGASPAINNSLAFQSANRTPTINFIQNNQIAIGTELSEVTGNQNLAEIGHSAGIPGIHVGVTNFEKMLGAMEAAAKRAAKDAGPSVIVFDTVRLQPHSNQHGDSFIGEMVNTIREEFEQNLQHPTEMYSGILKTLMGPSAVANQLRFRGTLRRIARDETYPLEVRNLLQAHADTIIDPVEEALTYLEKKGGLTADEREMITGDEKETVRAIYTETTKPERAPKVETVRQYTRMHTPSVEELVAELGSGMYSYPDRERIRGGAFAIREALMEAMAQNERIVVWGPDVNKGRDIGKLSDGQRGIIERGGYYHQTDYIWGEFGTVPGAIKNMAIDENGVSRLAMGLATVLTDPKSLAKGWRPVIDLQYIDYAAEGKAAFDVLASLYYTTRGKLTRPPIFILPSGAVPGGGPMHSQERAALYFQTPSNVDLQYASDPESTYRILRYALRYQTNPSILMVDKNTLIEDDNNLAYLEPGYRLMAPGEGLVKDLPGKDRDRPDKVQCIAYGPMVNKIGRVVSRREKHSIGLFDVVSLRPLPEDTLLQFLRQGSPTGSIIIAHEEPKDIGYGAQIYAKLMDNRKLRSAVNGREIIWIGADPKIPAISPEPSLMNANIPSERYIGKVLDDLAA